MKFFVHVLIAVSFIGVAQPSMALLEENLVLFFDFEGNDKIAVDRSANGNDGAIVGATPVEGILGKGLLCDGEDDTISFPLKGLLPTEGSILIWVKQLAVNPDNSSHFFDHYDPNRIYIKAPGGQLLVTLGNGGQVPTDEVIEKDVWYHLGLTWNKGKYTLYLDGELIQEGVYQGIVAINPTTHLCSHRGTQAFNHMMVDELMVYSVAVEQATIQQAIKSLAVFPHSKLSTTWAKVKAAR